mgnify:CR=1 FL=1
MDYKTLGLLPDLFVRQAEKTPDKIAVVSTGGKYQALRVIYPLMEWLVENLLPLDLFEKITPTKLMNRASNYLISTTRKSAEYRMQRCIPSTYLGCCISHTEVPNDSITAAIDSENATRSD